MNNTVIQKFKRFDKQILKTKNIKLIEIWFSLRYAIFYNFVSTFYFQKKKKNIFKLILKLLIQILQTIKIPIFLFKKEKILVLDTGRYKFYQNGYNDTVTEILKKNNFTFKTLTISNNSSLFDRKINILLLSNLLHILLKLFRREDAEFKLLEKKFFKFFGKNKVNFKNIFKQIYLQQISIFILFRFFIKIFNSKNVIYLENANIAKCIQYCGKHKIKTFDIQHALASELNILYKFYLTTKFKYLITKKIILWGNYWKKFYSHNTRCVSLGYFEKNKFYKLKKKKQIFIVSSIFSRKELIFLIKYLSLKLSDYKIIYKLRPEERYEDIEHMIDFPTKNVIFMRNSSLDETAKTIAKSQYIIGTNSTMLVEAYGITNIIVYQKGWFREYSNFIKNNIFLSAKSNKQVLSIIKTSKRNIYNKKVLNEIFKNKFNKNFKFFFNREIND